MRVIRDLSEPGNRSRTILNSKTKLGAAVLKHNVLRYSVPISILRCHDASPCKNHFGEMRASSVRDVLIYCRDHHCSHSATINADRWPDHVRLSDIEPGLVCSACGKRGAEVRPKFPQGSMGG